jgi:membrane associated rhomboid family serine protease
MPFELPRRVPPLIAGLILLTLFGTLAAALDPREGGVLYKQLALVPVKVWRGEVWRLVTWIFVEDDPWGLVLACVSLYWFGGDLVEAWGERHVARFAGAIIALAALGTTLLSLAVPFVSRYPHLGGWALGDALLIAWALQFPARVIRFYGIVELGGTRLAYGVLGFTVLCILFYGLAPFLPDVIAAGAALLYMTGTFGRAPERTVDVN